MSQKTILITGATDGIGKRAALELAQAGQRVLLHGRNPQRGQAVLDELRSTIGNTALEYFNADLASLTQVRRLAADVQAKHDRLDVLINNAGVFMNERVLTADGFETTFAVNHLAHFLLTNLFLDTLKRSSPARIITVASQVHSSGRINFDDLQLSEKFSGYAAYANSKLANVAFTYALAERMNGTGVTANCLHPGVIATKLLREGWGMGGAGVDAGATTLVYLATSPNVDTVTGRYFVDKREMKSSAASRDRAVQERLWQISTQLTGLDE
jgi:NAD(P)-dependent dehydrogenase (short-subunit alcohol dehydrogenase family)